ncbi:hypothetical protein EV127DRAFT_422015 [Xylaria flabelliformis]|nr:hypothetical protein EV127DRAFT_422015 [Xylaria flabelliformis]
MASSEDLDLPIALRRTTRQCARSTRSRVVSAPIPAPTPVIPKTPTKSRPKKRVRFSDPGPELSHPERISSSCHTGLTPMIKRSSLGGPSPKRRRGYAAACRPATIKVVQHEDAESPDDVDILSLPQVADGANHRIGRNRTKVEIGTPQQKNKKPRARKENSATTVKEEAEIQRLRAELANRDAEIERLHNATVVQDTGRIMELEQQIQALRAALAQSQVPALIVGDEDEEDGNASDGDNEGDLPQSFYDWTLAARNPFPGSHIDVDDDLEDMAMADVACSTPSRRRKSADAAHPRSVSASFPTPPCTSPTIPATPCSVRTMISPVTPRSHLGTQSMPDPEKEALEAELASLRLELTKLTETLDSHATLQNRLSKKLASASSSELVAVGVEGNQSGLEENVNLVLQKLSERTTALMKLESGLSSLGFRGTGVSQIIGSITSGFREARLELEYLTPGEITLPLSCQGAQVLDLALTRLRDLARKVRENEEAIDEYHAIELSLRQQLIARVDAMEGLRAEQRKTATVLRDRDAHIADLEIGLDRLKGAAEGYRRDIVQLETLVQRLDDDGKATEATLQADLDSAKAQLSERESFIADLEEKLANTLKQAAELQTKLKELQICKDAETKMRNTFSAEALKLKDKRISDLRQEIHLIHEKLKSAHETSMQLRIENTGLRRRAERAEEQEKLAREAVDKMKAELEKVTTAVSAPRRTTRSSSRESSRLATPEPKPGMFLSASLARSGSGKDRKRRRHDSGLGLLDEDEIEPMS